MGILDISPGEVRLARAGIIGENDVFQAAAGIRQPGLAGPARKFLKQTA